MSETELAAGSRDETAFSIDPHTGSTLKPQGEVNAATSAMQALDRGDIDQATYDALVGHDEPMKAIPEHLAEVEAAKAEPAPAPEATGDETTAG